MAATTKPVASPPQEPPSLPPTLASETAIAMSGTVSSRPSTPRRSLVPRGLITRLRHRSSTLKAALNTPQKEEDEEVPSLPDEEFYQIPVYTMREVEYPHMKQGIYLDHSGTTIYAKSLVDSFAERMKTNLYGNPHSANGPAEKSGHVVDSVREKALRFLGADPKHFDLVFVANSTAGIKLVADSFRDLAEKTRSRSFWYGYHKDCHTSLVGVRELTNGQSHCFESDSEVERWLDNPEVHGQDRRYDLHPRPHGLGLFAYPGQSNMSGRRLPLSWTGRIRSSAALQNTYTLLDCAALAMTSPLHNVFRDPDGAPDFTCVSFYKIFGFPDLGALIVRKDSGHILTLRKYFGGGTVTMVSVLGGTWHKLKGRDATDSFAGGIRQDHGEHSYEIHDALEDGTLPFHSILALGEAIDVHYKLYGSMVNISRHTTALSIRLYQKMRALMHANDRPLVHIYSEDDGTGFGDPKKQGATIAFNLLDSKGYYIPYSDVERIANENGCYVRSGGICCPGGIFTALEYEPWQLQRAFSAHHTCGPDGISLIQQLPTGVVRASLGAMSTRNDVDAFISFLQWTFLNQGSSKPIQLPFAERDYQVTNPDRRQSDATLVCAAHAVTCG